MRPAKSGGGSYTFLIVIVVLFGLLYFVMIRPQRNKQRQAQRCRAPVRPGQRVRTTAGMYATVVDADDQDVVLEVAPGVQMRFLRRAVMETLPDDDGTAGLDGDGTGRLPPSRTSPQDAAAEGTTDGPAAPSTSTAPAQAHSGPASTGRAHRSGRAHRGLTALPRAQRRAGGHAKRRTDENWLPQAVTSPGPAGRWPCWAC